MNRFVILTVGKTHSGKTTFAKALEEALDNSLVIDQDNHAEFIHQYYKKLEPKQGPNTLKHSMSQMIVDYAVAHTDMHLIICNANRSLKGRLELLEQFHNQGFRSILVYFDVPDRILRDRISQTERSTTIFRSATTFEEVLTYQNAESQKNEIKPPKKEEADHL